jgi:hypothetical protein
MTLRQVLIGIGAVLLVIAVGCFAAGLTAPGVLVVAFEAAVLIAALVFERFRYQAPLDAPPGPGWERTDETFVDPSSGETLRVYFERATGKRAYVREKT